jgi:hypothetical protein
VDRRSRLAGLFAFEVAAGQTLYFDEVTGTCASDINWRCVAPDGSVVFDDRLGGLSCGTDVGSRTFTQAGVYSLTVSGELNTTNTYHFRIYTVPTAAPFALNLGDHVKPGSHGPGSGRIETPGSSDIYTFTVTAGQAVFFEEPVGTCFETLEWSATDPNGTVLFDEVLGGQECGENAGRKVMANAGVCTITVFGRTDSIGDYEFRAWDAPTQTFAITTDIEISNGAPGAGAGNIETPGAQDVYTFTGAAGQRVTFQDQEAPPNGTELRWQLTDETGALVFDNCLRCTPPGLITLTRGGNYTLTVGSLHGAVTGTYRLRLTPMP